MRTLKAVAVAAVVLLANVGCMAKSAQVMQAERRALVDRPMTISGRTLEGREFSTSQWRGKVVVVHFWASWCPDSREELPEEVAWYKKYHPQGLEMVGVSSDRTAAQLRRFLDLNVEVSWTQLYTWPGWSGRHPLNGKYSVDWIPTLFIIDKNGVCRSVNGEKDMDTLVPKLLAEDTGR